MIDLLTFAKNFNGLTIPDALIGLLEFQNKVESMGSYSSGFKLMIDEEKYGLRTYSEDQQFLNSILEFADADGTGSSYGFWLKDNTDNLSEAPIVVFGGEGGYHVVAENIYGLLEILSFDAEPMVSWDEVNYYKDENDFEPSEQYETFKKWLFDNFRINQTNNAENIIKAAQIKYQVEFVNWMENYYAD